ncbi:MAG: hypothetical protein ABII93_09010 [Chrysiogenia bacterium]
MFKGKWLVRYKPGEFFYPEVLPLLSDLQSRLEQQRLNYRFLNVNLSRNIRRNRFFVVADNLFIQHNGGEGPLAETDPGAFPVRTHLKALKKPIASVDLIFPRLPNDPRWKTMGLPAAQLFLAASLQAHGFRVAPLALDLPASAPGAETGTADMLGFTLFEDLLVPMRDYLTGLQTHYPGILAAGGPLLTLMPLVALYHLPQISLAVRGEAEIALPEILKALNLGDLEALFRQSGVFWHQPGLIVLSSFERVNRPETFKHLQTDFNFLKPAHLEQGLEINFSRGCGRGCVFCCRVQGRKFRKLPLEKAKELLNKYGEKIREFSLPGDASRAMNINDDDILQDPAYAAAVFALLKKYNFRVHGIQTSPAALMQSDGTVHSGVLDLASDPELYIDGRPLLWLGTDVFLPPRAKRLGKRLPSPETFAVLLVELEKRGLRHFHYWISSDGASSWEEFAGELALIIQYHRDFANFNLLAHAPFIVPYPASRLFRELTKGGRVVAAMKLKTELRAPDPLFDYILPERLETAWPNLNRLLNNEKAGGETGFFGFLKEKDFKAAAQLAYHFLKQEELQGEKSDQGLQSAQKKLEETIAKFL